MNRTNIDEQGQRAQQEVRGTRISERVRREGEGVDMSRLREVGRNLGAQIEEQVDKRPYVVIGAAAGIGFVAGSLFGSRLGQVLLAAGLGYLAKNVLNGDIDVERIQEGLEKLAHERARG
jgi:ElaB/YqjD/DUF883 family membrane-anchored ribosome-binding protein